MKSSPIYIQIAERIKADWLSNPLDADVRKLPTQEELSESYKVSRSTIVRSLSKLVAEGYLHSQQGSGVYIRNYVGSRSRMDYISLIVPNLHASVIVQVCLGAERRARQLGYQPLLASSDNSVEQEKSLISKHLLAGVKGIALYPVVRDIAEIENDYLNTWDTNIPLVSMDIGYDSWPCNRVHFDNFRLGYDMTRLLIRHGHKNIAFFHISHRTLHNTIMDRGRGWEAAMKEAELDIPETYLNWPGANLEISHLEDDFVSVAQALMNLNPRPDAVICWDDPAAARMINVLLSIGVKVPGEIRVVGFDCYPLVSRLFRPLFPTSKPDFARLGELAVDVLKEAIEAKRTHCSVYYYPVSVLWRDNRSPNEENPEVEITTLSD